MDRDIRWFLKKLAEENELLSVPVPLSPRFEIPAVLKYLPKREKNLACLFESVKGYDGEIVGNLFGTKRRLAIAMGVSEKEIQDKIVSARENLIPPVIVDEGPVKEVAIYDKGFEILKTIPVLTHHEKDAGPYLTCAVTFAKDPETGMRGMGLHRIQVKNQNTLGIFLASPPLSHFLAKSEQMGRPLEVAIAVGVNPLILFSSVIFLPTGVDKLSIAGALQGEPVRLVRCRKLNLEVPANAEFALEGYIVPGKREKEGPFGESTGCYLTYRNPVVKVIGITHRRNAIYHGLMPFAGEEEVLLDFSWEVDTLREIQEIFPCVRRVHLLNIGLLVIVQISNPSEGEVSKLIDHLLANPFIKIVIVVDDDVDLYNYREVFWAISTRVQPQRDLSVKEEADGLMIDPSTVGLTVSDEFYSTLVSKTSKMGIDATKPRVNRERFERVDVPEEAKEKALNLIEKLFGFTK